jgi:hypothetical protein
MPSSSCSTRLWAGPEAGLAQVLSTLGLLISCATSPEPVVVQQIEPVGDPFSLPGEELSTQRLLRVHYDGPQGQGSLRLVLRLEDTDRFQLLAADTLGRSLWSLHAESTWAELINHREKWFCEAHDDVVLPERALAALPLRAVPRLLLGYVPVRPIGAAGSGWVEYTDPNGQRWTVTWKDGQAESWTQWVESRPALWWTRRAKGGILSHRDGIQFRWREVVNEPLEEDLGTLPVPEEYQQVSCHDPDVSQFRQDQPPP